MRGLYLHLPFCARKCHYCNFVIAIAGDRQKHARFLSALEREIAHRAVETRGTVFDTFYAGGGTPTALRVDEIERVFASIRKHFLFVESAEITWEANPADLTREKADLLRSLGVTRVSLGAQSFDDATLKALNRDHDSACVDSAFSLLRGAGFKNINLDLMLSLPGDTPEKIEHSLERTLALGPEHVSLYELVIEPHTAFHKARSEGRLSLPGEKEQLEALRRARQFLKQAGYRHYELLNYAKPGYESKHNLIYWANREYLGLGPGAYSYWSGRRFQFSRDFAEYLKKVELSDWTAAEEETLTPEETEVESMLLALRLEDGAELSRFASARSRFSETIAKLSEQGLISENSGRMRLTERGQYFAETVFAELSRE